MRGFKDYRVTGLPWFPRFGILCGTRWLLMQVAFQLAAHINTGTNFRIQPKRNCGSPRSKDRTIAQAICMAKSTCSMPAFQAQTRAVGYSMVGRITRPTCALHLVEYGNTRELSE
jgi:hypothetical protein